MSALIGATAPEKSLIFVTTGKLGPGAAPDRAACHRARHPPGNRHKVRNLGEIFAGPAGPSAAILRAAVGPMRADGSRAGRRWYVELRYRAAPGWMERPGPPNRDGQMGFSPSLAGTILLFVAAVGAGIAAIVAARRWLRPSSSGEAAGQSGRSGLTGIAGLAGHGDWESTIAAYKNLRDEGVLSEEEFRKIRTLVEPLPRNGMPELRARHRPPTDPAGPAHARE